MLLLEHHCRPLGTFLCHRLRLHHLDLPRSQAQRHQLAPNLEQSCRQQRFPLHLLSHQIPRYLLSFHHLHPLSLLLQILQQLEYSLEDLLRRRLGCHLPLDLPPRRHFVLVTFVWLLLLLLDLHLPLHLRALARHYLHCCQRFLHLLQLVQPLHFIQLVLVHQLVKMEDELTSLVSDENLRLVGMVHVMNLQLVKNQLVS